MLLLNFAWFSIFSHIVMPQLWTWLIWTITTTSLSRSKGKIIRFFVIVNWARNFTTVFPMSCFIRRVNLAHLVNVIQRVASELHFCLAKIAFNWVCTFHKFSTHVTSCRKVCDLGTAKSHECYLCCCEPFCPMFYRENWLSSCIIDATIIVIIIVKIIWKITAKIIERELDMISY